MKRTKSVLLGLLLAAALPFSCSDYGNDLQYVKEGSIHVLFTDAPYPTNWIESAEFTVTKIEARLKTEDAESSESEGSSTTEENQGSPYQVLFEGSEVINISELTNGMTRSMGVSAVPAGTYDLFRVYVTDASLTLTDGRTFDVKVPSGSQSGVKIFVKPSLEVTGEETNEVLFDMDISKSFVLRGNTQRMEGINGFIFKPVIRVVNLGYAGSVSGMVTNDMEEAAPIAGAQVSLMAADTVYTTTFTDDSGGYKIMGIEAGAYTIQASADGFSASETIKLQIDQGSEVTRDFVLMPE
ncbi:Carboxypeptidase regulatory-like domain-containing protein [Robiginitalea myxolifaciens]|uniref:Carboxypeptidase regulatory-like domain-containing protein n=1 Tax=Robiginitalea myxolifaciens TaxID=400055 RepID=A0A1I6FYH5_9FLAO|nr:DUF4382 domain-containing protein [Robiginitalea myxolifaciens]SFR34983.1 Carboxypeptidase regulatory-like domain-containing protein [Robiginitalea myxolifaciens]